jgi:hypothetical protein
MIAPNTVARTRDPAVVPLLNIVESDQHAISDECVVDLLGHNLHVSLDHHEVSRVLPVME